MKELINVMLLVSLCTVTITHADTTQPSLENAHAFIKEMIKQKKLGGYEATWWTTEIKNFNSEYCATSYTVEHRVSTFFEMRGRTEISIIKIDWGQVSKVSKGSLSHNRQGLKGLDLGLWVNGGIQENGENRNFTIFDIKNSDVTADRLIKAMDFIRQQCDTTKSKYGF